MNFEYYKTIPYIKKGDSPLFVIQSGTHGDEYHIIDVLNRVVATMQDTLPAFYYFPQMSPTAVKNQNRNNCYGNDINRNFGDLSDPEVDAHKEIASWTKNALAISFREDLERENDFYVYDSGEMDEQHLNTLRTNMRELGVSLFTGIDDPDDVALSYYIRDGYVDFVGSPRENGQFIEDWAIYHGYYSRMLTFEIPYKHPKVYEILQKCIRFSVNLIPEVHD